MGPGLATTELSQGAQKLLQGRKLGGVARAGGRHDNVAAAVAAVEAAGRPRRQRRRRGGA